MAGNFSTTAGYSTGPPTNCTFLNRDVSANTCAWAALQIDGRRWYNASLGLDPTGQGLILTTLQPVVSTGSAPRMHEGFVNVTASSYGYGPIPLLSVETVAAGLPVLAWNSSSEIEDYTSQLQS